MRKMLSAGIVCAALLSFPVFPAAAEDANKKPSCGDVAVAIEEAADNVSPEEIAKKLNTSVDHVRNCWQKQEAPKKDAGSGTHK